LKRGKSKQSHEMKNLHSQAFCPTVKIF